MSASGERLAKIVLAVLLVRYAAAALVVIGPLLLFDVLMEFGKSL